MTDVTQTPKVPEIRSLSYQDVLSSLKAGFRDFRRVPHFGLFFGGIFSITGIVIFLQLIVWGSSYWVLPIAVGFPLLGPFLAVGLYEVSHRLQEKEFLSSHNVPIARFVACRSADDVKTAAAELDHPCILKTVTFGYDGKG